MESCSKENVFRRYYSPLYIFTKPEYFSDENCDNFELQEIYDNNRLTYKSPKKENRQPNVTNGNSKVEKSKRGSYNFNNKPQTSNVSFITRNDMLKVPDGKKPIEEVKFVWTLPK